ncbi:MAG: hypothetical protein V2I33_01960, partial [Kangiellaceae bacterium]|nr:hypothetical protein [Kangiellaceae bacterium]
MNRLHNQSLMIYRSLVWLCTIFLSAILFKLALPENSYFILSYIALVPIILLLESSNNIKKAFFIGLVFGSFVTLLVSNWLIDTAALFFNTNQLISWLFLLEVSLIVGLVYGLITSLYKTLRLYIKNVFLLPVTYLFFALIIDPTLSPLLAYGHAEFLFGIQSVDLFGIYGLEFIILLINSLIAQLILNGGLNATLSRMNIATFIAIGIVMTWYAI